MFERSHGMEWITILIGSISQMFVSTYSMSGSVLDRDETDRPSLIDLRLVDEPHPPTIHHVRAEVVGARAVAVVLEERGERWRMGLELTESSPSNSSVLS